MSVRPYVLYPSRMEPPPYETLPPPPVWSDEYLFGLLHIDQPVRALVRLSEAVRISMQDMGEPIEEVYEPVQPGAGGGAFFFRTFIMR